MSFQSTIRRLLSTKVKIPTNLKGKKKSSHEWLIRQLKDPYVERAKMLNYRCRSCFKLLEIDEKYKILKPGHVIVDCGSAPGSWVQVCVSKTNSDGSMENKPKGIVIGIDKLQIYPIPGAHLLGNTDFTTETAQQKIKEILNNRKADGVFSDMAPNASGIRSLDQENIMDLCYSVLKFATDISAPNATLLMKVWENGQIHKLEKLLQKYYENVKFVKPNASRTDSAEKFILARGFIGDQMGKTNSIDS